MNEEVFSFGKNFCSAWGLGKSIALCARIDEWPIVKVLEQGTAVSGTDCSCPPGEILEAGWFGILVPSSDPIALASAMLESLGTSHDHDAQCARPHDLTVAKAAPAYLELLLPNRRSRILG